MSNNRIPMPIITDNKIILTDGREFEWIEKRIATQRTDHDSLPEDFCEQYVLKTTYDSIYIYRNKWAYYKNLKETSENTIMYLIEKDKQKERIGNKYKYLKMTDKFTLKKFFPIYQDITLACDRAIEEFQEIFTKLKLPRWKKYPLSRWIEGSKLSKYKYNYLFTEYFEEEAN